MFFFVVRQADYRVAGENLLICCSNEGQVRGFKFSEQDANAVAANVYKDRQEAIRDLAQKKQVRRRDFIIDRLRIFQAILLELQNLEEAAKKSKETNNMSNKLVTSDSEAGIPVRRWKRREIIFCTSFLGKYRNSNHINSRKSST